jgi:subtilisin family serine protease
MKVKIIVVYVCILFLINSFSAVSAINKNVKKYDNQLNYLPNGEIVSGEFIIKFRDETIFTPSINKLNEKYNVISIEKMFSDTDHKLLKNIYRFRVPKNADILTIVNDYSLCGEVKYAEPNGIAYLCGIPNDPHFSKQWALHNTGQDDGTTDADIDAPEAWDIETGSSDIIIAVIDTGIDADHPDLADNIWINEDEIPRNGIDDDENGYIDDVNGWDWSFTDNNHYPQDKIGHGTACAGIAGALGNNNIGIVGVCWNCKIMPLQVFDENIEGHMGWIAEAVRYAADNGARVISMSIVIDSRYYFLRDMIDYAHEKGVVLVASAGNAGINKKPYPAGYNNVIAVGATDNNDSIMNIYHANLNQWITSNYGYWVDISAPGVNIYTTMPTYHVFFNDYGADLNYTYFTAGTSLSCPYVAGLAALILSKKSSLSPEDVRYIIRKNVDPYNSDKYIGTGRINAFQAVKNTKELNNFRIRDEWVTPLSEFISRIKKTIPPLIRLLETFNSII